MSGEGRKVEVADLPLDMEAYFNLSDYFLDMWGKQPGMGGKAYVLRREDQEKHIAKIADVTRRELAKALSRIMAITDGTEIGPRVRGEANQIIELAGIRNNEDFDAYWERHGYGQH